MSTCYGKPKNGDRPLREVVGAIIDDLRDGEPDGTPRADVVIATHRHKDHVAGFADLRWKGVEVKEVWMPWTEKPDDPVAKRIREAQARLAMQLALAPAINADPDLVSLVVNAIANEDAMVTLHEGFAPPRAPRRYLPETPA